MTLNASGTRPLRTPPRSRATRETNNIQDKVCLCPALQIICTLKLGAASSGGCHVLPAPFVSASSNMTEGNEPRRLLASVRAVSWRCHCSDTSQPIKLGIDRSQPAPKRPLCFLIKPGKAPGSDHCCTAGEDDCTSHGSVTQPA